LADNGKQTNSEQTMMHTIQMLQERIKVLETRNKELTIRLRDGVFSSREQIIENYGWSEHIFKKWVRMGLPVLIVDRSYYAHAENISEFFKNATRVSYKNAPDNVIDGDG